jgi:protein-S-isoprenylcysteine O-methyltransferase Ste14
VFEEQVLVVVVSANILGMLGAILSILFPGHRIWPPPGRDTWQFWVTWTVLTIGTLGVLVVGFQSWGSIGYKHWVMTVTGGVLIVLGVSTILWGVRALSLYQSFGLKGGLVTNGPYRHSRNPQYLGYLLFYPGFTLFTGSVEAFLTGILAMLIFLIAPLAEEPWLKEQYGKEYLDYMGKVPRFL